MKLSIRYDELKVRYTEDACILKNYSNEEIYIPAPVVMKLATDEWLPLNTGEKKKISWKDYLVDEVDNKGMGWVWYYPLDYNKNGYYYKIRADLYFEKPAKDGLDMCPVVTVANEMADAFYDNLKKKTAYKDKIYYNKAPNSRLVKKALPSKVSGDMFNITPICVWLKTGAYVDKHPIEKWLDEYSDYTRHMSVILECTIENYTCFIAMKHITIDTSK